MQFFSVVFVFILLLHTGRLLVFYRRVERNYGTHSIAKSSCIFFLIESVIGYTYCTFFLIFSCWLIQSTYSVYMYLLLYFYLQEQIFSTSRFHWSCTCIPKFLLNADTSSFNMYIPTQLCKGENAKVIQ